MSASTSLPNSWKSSDKSLVKSVAHSANEGAKSIVLSALNAASWTSCTIGSGIDGITGRETPTVQIHTYFDDAGDPHIDLVTPASVYDALDGEEVTMVSNALREGFKDPGYLENVRAAVETYRDVNKEKGRTDLASATLSALKSTLYDSPLPGSDLKFQVVTTTAADATKFELSAGDRKTHEMLELKLDPATFSSSGSDTVSRSFRFTITSVEPTPSDRQTSLPSEPPLSAIPLIP
ncbi:hypothetical protein BCR39DRAFT_585088 [Naematelia encephala]|uniref:Uncharacterized protein n=1 Tax=Naematelia encephala TaxID=71784 RepID=A0A1Y2BMR5_9TREE|nr:hypothetical protein BCR39DRAFT_585088 [Naematelia encephala]